MVLREWLDRGEAQLTAGPHPDRARRDAETLLLHVIGKSKAWLMTHTDEDFAGCTAIRYAGLLDRRAKGEPIQYITGETEFYGLPFRVTPDVLIPRPETEHLVEKALALATQLGAPSIPRDLRNGWETATASAPRILDIGTGSGAIAIALAHKLPNSQITAIDISESALAVARENAQCIGLADRIRFLQGDLLAPVARETFDFVVSNPPYVPNTDRALISVEVREYEPALALFAGPDSVDGLDIYRRLIPSAFAALVAGGFILLEMGFTQAPAIEELLKAAGFQSVEFNADLQGIPRVAIARRP